MRQILNTPHPIGFGWAYALIPALAVVFILTVLAPYGFAELSYEKRFLRAIPFGVITALSAPLNLLIAKVVFPKSIDETKWTIGREFIYNIYDVMLIGFWNSTFLYVIGRSGTSFIELLVRIESHTLMIGVIPVVMLIGFKNNEALRKQLFRAGQINDELKSAVKLEMDQDPVSLYSENGKLEIRLVVDKIFFFRSSGNYLEVFYKDEKGKEGKHLIRNRLKIVADLLPKEKFFHCHKSYIINIRKITRVEGNARDLRLSLVDSSHVIPVSRSRSAELLTILRR